MKKPNIEHINEVKNSLGLMGAQANKWEKVQLMEQKLTKEERELLLAEAKKYGYDEKLITNDETWR